MPSRLTLAQLESNTQLELELFRKDIETLQRDLTQFEIFKLRDRITALEVTVAELKRTKEESEKKRSQWIFWGIGVLVTLIGTFAVQMLILWVKK